ncbi:MAG: multiple antibiotic resistance protein [Bacteroidia bacterium]|jgi:multiple antibiotic resistance protein
MHLNLKEIATATMVLFAVIDIVGSVPIIIDLRQKNGNLRSGLASIVALVIMILFLFLGENILSLIGITVGDFAIAGSLVIFFLALEMILGIQLYKEDDSPSTASVVPLAFPLIAGAGTLTTLLSLRSEFHVVNILVAIIINIALVYLVLKTTRHIERFLGSGGINVLRKVFGIILLAIAVKLFRTNLGV